MKRAEKWYRRAALHADVLEGDFVAVLDDAQTMCVVCDLPPKRELVEKTAPNAALMSASQFEC
jgi:hypothetical protein